MPAAVTTDPTALPDDDPRLTTEQISRAIQSVLEALPPRQREVAVLRLHLRMSTAVIALRLGISPRTVEVHMASATRALRDRLPSLLGFPCPLTPLTPPLPNGRGGTDFFLDVGASPAPPNNVGRVPVAFWGSRGRRPLIPNE